MKKKVLIIVIFYVVMSLLLNPLYRSEESIRKTLLRITPLGTDMEKALKVIKRKVQWNVSYIDYEHGYFAQRWSKEAEEHYLTTGEPLVIGVMSIEVYLGGYWAFFITDVTAFWGFDESGKLIDICVAKDTDSP